MKVEKLIEEIFSNSFDTNLYEEFLTELFNEPKYEEEDLSYEIDKGFEEYIDSVYDYGEYTDANKDNLKLYVVKLKKTTSLERARTMQRNFIAKLLSKNWMDNALVAFYDDKEDWRFSFIKIDYDLDENGNVIEKLSPAKRHSYLVGPNQSNHTCQKQFINLINKEELIISELVETFKVENVTDEFFKEYKELFHKLTESINEIREKDLCVKEEFENKQIKSTDFAKKILGQIVFIYFIQKKGWLGVEQDQQWGTGPNNFLRKLYNKEYLTYNNFFNDVLEPLFYEGLSSSSIDNHYSKFNCKIPFINGGIFENINNYDWINTDVNIDNDIFEQILDTFDTFNFTVKEDEPLEKEVAIDPEMLGKVFEKLLEVNERKDEGAFYTPRNIVHEICQESLISYLYNNTDDIPLSDIKTFIKEGYLAIDSIIRVQEEKLDFETANQLILIPNTIISQIKLIEELINDVKVVDPAVGSGAFPVGMLAEIVQVKSIIQLLLGSTDINTYDLKRETIENSLYAVDISYSATDITKLRFWLSLIVDEESIDDIRPLPNLDNKIMCGNSVINEFEGVSLFKKDLLKNNGSKQTKLFDPTGLEFKKLIRYKSQYFNENSHEEKIKLKKQIQKSKWKFIEESIQENVKRGIKQETVNLILDNIKYYEYSESKPFFIWELEFSEIFTNENPGFDIVIGNPPYVDLKERMTEEIIQYYKDTYENIEKRQDLYVIFIEKAKQLLKNNGTFGFIIPNSYLLNESYIKSRKDLYNNYSITNIYRVPKVFDAIVDPIILLFTKNKTKNNKVSIKIFNENIADKTNFDDYYTKTISQIDLFDKDTFGILIYQENNTKSILAKIELNHPLLSDIYSVNLGLTPYDAAKSLKNSVIKEFNEKSCSNIPFNEYDISKLKKEKKEMENKEDIEKIDKEIIQMKKEYKEQIINTDLFKSKNKEDKTCKKLITGENIKKYHVDWFNRNGYVKYGKWLGSPRNKLIFTEPRVLIRQIITNEKIYAGYTEEELYNAQIGFNIIKYPPNKKLTKLQKSPPVGLKYILAILNSKMMNYYHTEKYLDKNKKTQQKILVANAKKFPIAIPEPNSLNLVEKLVDKMIDITQDIQKEITNYQKYLISKSTIEDITSRSSKELCEFYKYNFEEHYSKSKVINKNDKEEIRTKFIKSKERIKELIDKQNILNEKIEEKIFNIYCLSNEEKNIIKSAKYNH